MISWYYGYKKEKQIGHYNLPWDDEAYTQELELFIDLVNTTDILDDYIDKQQKIVVTNNKR